MNKLVIVYKIKTSIKVLREGDEHGGIEENENNVTVTQKWH